jgi:hypothetical protein
MVVEQDEQDIAGLTKLPDIAALSRDKPPAAAPGAVILDVGTSPSGTAPSRPSPTYP